MISMYWLPVAVFLPHVAEEWSEFPAWATRHFGATSRAYYVYSHVALIAAEVFICRRAASGAADSTWPLLATAVQVVLATNALFHLTTTFLFREYSPGVVTGTLLFLPATGFLIGRTLRDRLLSTSELGVATALGVVVGAAVVASLWLKMDFDYRLRRRTAPQD